MPNVVAIIKDERARRQTEQFLQQLGMDDLRFAMFTDHQEFAELYFRDKPVEPPLAEAIAEKVDSAATNPGDGPDDLKLFSEIHLLIFSLDSIDGKSSPWLDKVKLNLKKFNHWPQAGPLRVIMMKYEDDNISKLDLLHPMLDDLVYLPLDRLVFLQKMEIFLNLPKLVKPNFLFNQEVKQEIEISKITHLDRLSDVGLAIRNPIPLKKGLPGHFYITLPSEKSLLEIRGKVFRSEPHPDFPGQYLVYFTYFGLPRTALSKIRQMLSKIPRYQGLYTDDRSKFRHKSEDIFATADDLKKFGVAVIDPDEQAVTGLADQLGKDMDRLKIVFESSYNLFLHKYFEAEGSSAEKVPPKASEPTDFYKNPFTISLSVTDLKCLSVDPGPEVGDLILGHPAMDIFATPDKWLTLISEKASRLILEDAVQFANRGRPSDKVLILQDAEGKPRAANFKLRKGAAENLVTAEISPASLSDIVEKMTSDELTKELDALVFDSAFVPEDAKAWVEGLRTRAAQVGLVKGNSQLKFFIVSEGEAHQNKNWLNLPDILGLFIKPADHRQLLFLLSEYLPNKDTVYHFENIGWAQPSLSVHVSKEMQLEALSEFGAMLKSKQPLAPGSMIYLRKSIYDNAPNRCLAARVYACEPHSSEKDFFSIYTIYFGINDHFLKFARTWIRENYAAIKGKEQT